MKKNNHWISVMERVVLRGIEGLIGDEYLLLLSKGHMEDGLIGNFAESKQMAEQVYAGWKGWTDVNY